MGITHADDDFGTRVSDVFHDIPNTRRVVGDIRIFSQTYEEHMETVRQKFTRTKEHSISLNPRKVGFAKSSAPFGGFIVDAECFGPDPTTRANSQFPTPLNITDFRTFFGLCQQLKNFSTDISSALVSSFKEGTHLRLDFNLRRCLQSSTHGPISSSQPSLLQSCYTDYSPRRRFPSQRPGIPPETEKNRCAVEIRPS
jgi:hypothetical protein